MSIVDSDIYLPAAGLGDASPYTPVGATNIKTGLRVLSETFRPRNAGDGQGGFFIAAEPTQPIVSAEILLGTGLLGDRCGVTLIDPDGDGYIGLLNFDQFRIHPMTAFAVGGAQTFDAPGAPVAGERYKIEQEGTALRILIDDVVLNSITVTDVVRHPGVWTAFDNSGNLEIDAVGFNGYAAASGIDSINDGTVQGGTTGNTLVTVDFIPVSLTIGDLAVTLTSVDAENYTFTMPAMAEGYYPPFGSVTATAVNAGAEESTLSVTHVIQDGYTATVIASLSDDESSIYSQLVAQHEFELEIGGTLYGEYTLYNDTTYEDWPDGTNSIFYRPPASNDLVEILIQFGAVSLPDGSGGITARNITLRGITMRNITARSL